jgi:hypothetical protein
MRNNVIAGTLLAVGAALVVGLGSWWGLDLEHVALLGAALGGVIGLVPDRPAWARLTAFGVGFAAAWLGFALRAALLPDAASGRAVAAFVVVLVCLAVSAASLTRLPLWAMLVGAAAIVGAYEQSYTSSPSQFLTESPTAATTVLLAAAIGYLATAFLGPQVAAHREADRRADRSAGRPDDRAAGRDVPGDHRTPARPLETPAQEITS